MDKILIDFTSSVDSINETQNIEQLWIDTCSGLGFDTLNYTYAKATDCGELLTSHITTFSPKWMEYYSINQMPTVDYMVDYIVARKLSPFIHDLDTLEQANLDTELKRDLWHGAAEYGMHRALVVPFIDLEGDGFVGVSLGSSTLNSIDFSNTVESHGSALFSIAHIAHQKLHNTLRQRSFNIEFTARQREIALLLLEGHTNKEMSYRLKVSIPTISFHLKDIREKLQVKTTREIVPKLLSLGWKG